MKNVPLLLLTLCTASLCHSQSGLHINGAATFTIRANTTVSIDGLALTPSSNYTITGANRLIRASTLQHPSIMPAINRSFQWATTLPSFTGNISFYYEDAELNGLSEADLTLTVHNGTQWQTYSSGANRNTATNVVATPVSGLLLNELTLTVETLPLPLKWGSVTASRKKDAALIKWETHNEIQTAFFEIERSADGLHWNAIGQRVQAQSTSGIHHYQLIDSTVPNSKTFYRIKQVDIDEKVSYSYTVWVPALYQPIAVSIYPNPASQQLFVRSADLPLRALRLYDANGKLIKAETMANSLTHTITVSTLPNGVYRVQIQLANGNVAHFSFLKN